MPHVIHESGPARHRQAVAVCCDAGYLPYPAFVAYRLADLNPQHDFDVAIFSLECQGLLNCVLMGHWLDLSPVWNWQYSGKPSLIETQGAVRIGHCIHPVKSWNDHKSLLSPRLTRPVAGYLKSQFPDHPAVLVGQGVVAADRFRSILRRRWLKSYQIARCTGQFPTDLTAIS